MSTLTRYRPFHSLRQEIDRFFDEFGTSIRGEGNGDAFSAVWAPRMDLSETEDAFVVKMDLPGIQKEEVTVNVEDSMLAVSGERKEEKKEKQENYLRMERSYGSFYRSVPLPITAKIDEVKAAFKNGVLTIQIPKVEESKPHKVEIA